MWTLIKSQSLPGQSLSEFSPLIEEPTPPSRRSSEQDWYLVSEPSFTMSLFRVSLFTPPLFPHMKVQWSGSHRLRPHHQLPVLSHAQSVGLGFLCIQLSLSGPFFCWRLGPYPTLLFFMPTYQNFIKLNSKPHWPCTTSVRKAGFGLWPRSSFDAERLHQLWVRCSSSLSICLSLSLHFISFCIQKKNGRTLPRRMAHENIQ